MDCRGRAMPGGGCIEASNVAHCNGRDIRCYVGHSYELLAQELRRSSAVNTRTFVHPDPVDQCVGGVALWDSGG